MASAAIPRRQSIASVGFLVLVLLNLGLDRWAKGSIVTTFVHYVFLVWVPIWLAFKIRAGYRYRKPHWTRESWLRYLRLMALPVGALIVMLSITYFLDPSKSTFGAPQSATRVVWALVLIAMLLFGAIVLPIMINWMAKGEPSEQFTRTRLFRRGGSSPIAD